MLEFPLNQLHTYYGYLCYLCPLTQRFPNFFSSGDHFYQSECSTDHPTVVRFESKLFKILNHSV
jgi:hypothetical protein